jgi:hypothetical protein
MIEVVIAAALTALIVTAVYTATNAMTGVARRQTEIDKQATRLSRFLEILERDVRGWSAAQGLATPAPPSAPDSPDVTMLLDISSTADGFAQGVKPAAAAAQESRAVHVQYVCRPCMDGFEVVRSESGGGGTAPLELSLLGLKRAAQIEFYSGRAWSNNPPAGQARPAALRITLDDRTLTIRP